MNRTKTKEIYGRDYCVFCMKEAELETTCKLERSYRKMIQLELF